MESWTRIVGFLVVGYLCMTRSFAYVGLPPLKIFIGEIVLAAFLLLKPRVALGTWTTALLRPSPLNAVCLALLAFMIYGVAQLVRGVLGGNPFLWTLQFFVLNYYALYLFLGIWVGLHTPDFLPKLVRVLAWVNGIYGLMFLVALNPSRGYVAASMPGSDVTVFGQPGGTVAILLLLCFERDLRAIWPVLALNMTVALAMQVRAEWLGLALGLLVWGHLTHRLGRVVATGMAGLVLVGMIDLAGLELPGRTANHKLTLGEIVGRAIAPMDSEIAKNFTSVDHAGTAEWRERWWDGIWSSVHSTPMLAAFGHGYGFHLLGVAPKALQEDQVEENLRTPHSIFFYTLGYTGWVGVALFGAFQLTILALLWRSFRVTGQPAGVAVWVMGMAMACFEPSFETPFRAIPFYLLVGMTIAPGLLSSGASARSQARLLLRPNP